MLTTRFGGWVTRCTVAVNDGVWGDGACVNVGPSGRPGGLTTTSHCNSAMRIDCGGWQHRMREAVVYSMYWWWIPLDSRWSTTQRSFVRSFIHSFTHSFTHCRITPKSSILFPHACKYPNFFTSSKPSSLPRTTLYCYWSHVPLSWLQWNSRTFLGLSRNPNAFSRTLS